MGQGRRDRLHRLLRNLGRHRRVVPDALEMGGAVMIRLRSAAPLLAIVATAMNGMLVGADRPAALRFNFGPCAGGPDWVVVSTDATFSAGRGYGFESNAGLSEFHLGRGERSGASGVTGMQPFIFSTRVPTEGNYRVSVRVGHPANAGNVTIK